MKLAVKGNRVRFALALAAALAAASPQASADALDKLLGRLREKSIITQSELEELRGEMRVQQEGEKKRAAAAGSVRFRDGFALESGDGRHAIGISGRLHADYRSFSNDSGTAAAPSAASADTFDVRRAYLGVNGRFYDDWTFDVIADFAQGGADLDVAWLNYAGFRPAQVRIGQFKMPFSLEEQMSSRFIDFQERGLPNALVPGKERGIMVHGAPHAGVYYGLALSNGQGKNTNEPNAAVDDKDVIGRLVFNAAEAAGNKDAVLHLGGAFSRGTLPVAAAPAARTEGRGLTFFTAAAFTGAGAAGLQEMKRERRGAEAALAWKQFKFQGETVRASFSGASAAGIGFERGITSSYLGANWLVTGESYAASYRGGAFGAIRPRQEFRARGGGWGALEVGLRYSAWDAGDFAAGNPAGTGVLAAGSTSGARAWTLGATWIPNINTRVYLNLVRTRFDTPVTVVNGVADEETALTMRAGFYF